MTSLKNEKVGKKVLLFKLKVLLGIYIPFYCYECNTLLGYCKKNDLEMFNETWCNVCNEFYVKRG